MSDVLQGEGETERGKQRKERREGRRERVCHIISWLTTTHILNLVRA